MITNITDSFFAYLRKGLLATVAFVFVFAIIYVPIPNNDNGHLNVDEVYATGGGPWDLPNFLENLGGRLIQVRDFVVQNWLWVKENVLDGIFWRLGKEFISNMVADTIDWINSGFEGSPAFVQDLGDTLLRSADVAVGEFINDLGEEGSFVCSPFRFDVQLAVAIHYDLEREGRAPTCTLTDVITNFEDFINGDFRSGGWAGWFDLVAQPQSLPYGSMLTAKTQVGARVVNAKGEELSLLEFGDGFFSIPQCESAGDDDGGEREVCSVVSPGTVVANSLNKALGSGQDSLVAADEVDEIFVALLGQLTSRLVGGAAGVLGLSGGGAPSYDPYDRGGRTPFTDDLRDGDGRIGGDGTGGTTGVDGVAPGGISNNTGQNMIESNLAFLSTASSSAARYIIDLRNFINNPRNDENDVFIAEIFVEEARELLVRINSDYVEATPIRDRYVALETEYITADLERRTDIRDEQATLFLEFTEIGLISDREFEAYTSNWDRLLARDVPPPPPPTPIEIDCDIFPSNPACLDPSDPGPIR